MNNTQKVIKIGAIALAIIIIINIFSLILSGLSWLFAINLTTTNNEEVTTFKEIYQNVRAIEIDGIASSIEITSGTEFKVEATNLENRLTSNIKNGILKIEEHNKWFYNGTNNGTIYITIPSNTILDELSIDTGAGKFTIQDITAKEFEMDHGAGVLEIENVNFSKTDIDGGAGKILIKNSTLNNLELDAGAGKVELIANITGNSEINCGVGEVDITLIGTEEDYQIATEKGIGSIKVNGVDQKNSTIYGTGNNKLQIEGGIGSIEVSFKQ